MKKFVIVFTLCTIVFVLAGLVYIVKTPAPMHTKNTTAQKTITQKTITLGSAQVAVEVASTEVEREQGLSGHMSLKGGEGMLFVFEHPSNWGIWMKDMHFPIDIMWVASDGTILSIAHNVAPSTYPEIFYPQTPTAMYVIELPSGFTEKEHIKEGLQVNI